MRTERIREGWIGWRQLGSDDVIGAGEKGEKEDRETAELAVLCAWQNEANLYKMIRKDRRTIC